MLILQIILISNYYLEWNKIWEIWDIGEDTANDRPNDFLESGLKDSKEERNPLLEQPIMFVTLHFGEISPNHSGIRSSLRKIRDMLRI